MGNVVRKTLQVKSDPKVHQDGLTPYEMLKLQQVGLLGKQWMVHQRHIIPELLHPKPGVDFIKRCRRHLINRILQMDGILDNLWDNGTLTAANLDAINIYAIQREKMRILVDLVLRKGTKAQEAFCMALNRSNPFLLEQLYYQTIKDQKFSEGSVHVSLLNFLVSDELKCLQWVIDGHPREEDSSRPRTWSLLENHFGSKLNWKKIVPTLSICFKELVASESWEDVTMGTNTKLDLVEVSPNVFEDGTMFRLQCNQLGLFHCRLTGLQLEGVGDLLYQLLPWDLDFLSSKGLRPAGPLFRFTLLSGRFHRLHLPHCQLLPETGQHFLSVVHAREERVDLIAPSHVTESHVTIDVSGFSCFGLVTKTRSKGAIRGLVVVFSQMTEHCLFVLLLPRNICLTQLIEEWKRRIGAKYVETIPDCELIPNQEYKLSGQHVTLVQPESAEFVNFSDYTNFLPSFQVQVPQGAVWVELQLMIHVTPLPLIGWLFGSMDAVVWHRVIQLRVQPAAGSTGNREGSLQPALNLLQVLDSLGKEELSLFQYHLKLQPDPISASRLENADRTKTVDLMLWQYQPEGARQVAADILRAMKFQDLADQVSS